MNSVSVAVVGGGIGGLTAALALHAAGARVDVYEQAPRLGEVGAGVALFANSIRVLRRLGVADEMARCAAATHEFWFFQPDGALSGRQMEDGDLMGAWGMYRPDIVSTLAAVLPTGSLHTGHRLTELQQDGTSAVLTFDNQVSAEVDVVVGADGIHSTLQRHVVEPRRPVFSGMVAYRGVIDAGSVPDWPWREAMVAWGGQGKHFLVFPVRGGELLNYVGFVPADEQMQESWSAPGDPAVLAAEFTGWDPWVGRILSQVRTTNRWGLYDRDPLPRWTEGRLTLLGDAAHPMLPHLGQGANQAIEDGLALATLIRGVSAADVPDALSRYEQCRRERTATIQQRSRDNGLRADSGRAITMGQSGVQDYDVEAAALAAR